MNAQGREIAKKAFTILYLKPEQCTGVLNYNMDFTEYLENELRDMFAEPVDETETINMTATNEVYYQGMLFRK